ncbi:DNA-binding transcriptional regulator, LysR family [Faunimonas pinastri]|uniref:DNA-binding transcriptional regulator, LysR family n=1 Tax=Faunimonas pinastri TaxID=1855383 RepID=A0A1H9HRB7_9HYPH|nr:LysR family transcriptional regulator [Faunimonas pinastri]SEQ64861.1 DNA-binding transcriptional regulator, LysR family [Faunimonas pinastri]
MRRNLDIALLRTFAAVADQHSMTGASQVLHLTQGAVSQQIARLEELVGDQLLRREPRGLRLTPAGERLLGRARTLLALNDEIWSEIAGGGVAGPVRLGLPYDLIASHFGPALKSYCEAFPLVDLDLVCLPSPDLLAGIRDGQLDVAVVEEALGAESGETLAIDRLVWVGARGGQAHGRTPLPLSLVAETCLFRPPVLQALTRQKRASRAVFENGGLDATRTTVRMDLAVSAWLATTVPADLAILPPEAGLPELPSFAITLHVAHAARGAAIEELTRHLRETMARPSVAA